eukprot:CAMPEP_0185256044 /NCGR_PEP_ID=MMETSP1359-20130426/5117_1 /TAXON_ID=552665 /ORGANISM="Bigelowiella longifila, Strain CCMP242" /LENGTH=141 /DNA_ID=CAMNT_0027840361 /DNA_START=354 /DNA_END=776 /DNA_ORIENTATION=+
MKENLKESVKSVHDAIDKEADILGLEKSKCVALLGLGQGGVVAILAGLSYKGGLCNVTCTGTEGFPMKELVVQEDSKSSGSVIAQATKDIETKIVIINTRKNEDFATKFGGCLQRSFKKENIKKIIIDEDKQIDDKEIDMW